MAVDFFLKTSGSTLKEDFQNHFWKEMVKYQVLGWVVSIKPCGIEYEDF